MVFETVRRLLSKQLEISPDEIEMDTDILQDLGADSLDIVELIMALEEELGLAVTDEKAGGLTSVRQIVGYLEEIK